jgi:hypothetical protein
MRIFLAGIMQGSHRGADLHDQDYRDRIRTVLSEHVPDAELFCPFDQHRNSLEYDDGFGRQVFLEHIELAAQSDVLVAYVPEASMGTALEMWAAHRAGRLVLTISSMPHNWVVRFLSDRIFSDLDAFERAVRLGELRQLLTERNVGEPAMEARG